MKRVALTAAFAALALPGTAIASRGVVLSVHTKHRSLEIVDAHHVVHSYSYAGRLPSLQPGSRIAFVVRHDHLRHVRVVSSGSQTVAFLARVISSSSRGVVFRLGDGSRVRFSSGQVVRHRAHRKHLMRAADQSANVSINIEGLEPGVTVLVTETVATDGSISITITLPSSSAPGVGGEQQASGVVDEVDSDTFVLTTDDGSDLVLHIADTTLANLHLQVCDDATATYHQDGAILVADTVQDAGHSASEDCAGDDQDVVGAITEVSPSSITISVSGRGVVTFPVDPGDDLTDGFVTGDVVDVTYYSNGDGTYAVDDIEYADQDVTGVVTAVSDGALTITKDATGQSQTFTADPSLGDFDGVSVGDEVDVYCYANTTEPGVAVVDWVDDRSTD